MKSAQKSFLFVFSFALWASSCLTLPENAGNALDPLSANYVPTAPLVYAYVVASKSVQVTWNDRSLGETGFEVVRSVKIDSGYVLLATVPANETVYLDTDTAFVSGKNYYYRVRAFTKSTFGPYSNESIVLIP